MSPAEQQYREGRALFNRGHDRAIEWIESAARAGHLPAIQDLADGMGGENSFAWSVKLAALGDAGPLVSNITGEDFPVERSREVYAAALEGTPWAQLAVARLYRLGMRNGRGVLLATQDGAFGFLPGVPDPSQEGLTWAERAHEAGWTAATLYLADTLRREAPARSIEYAKAAMSGAGPMTPSERARVPALLAELLDKTEASLGQRFELYTRLAADGHAAAHAWLGDRFRLGEGVAMDLAAARAHYERGVATGSTDAMRELGKMCEEGDPVDLDRARALYESAAELAADEFSRERLATRFGLAWYASEPT